MLSHKSIIYIYIYVKKLKERIIRYGLIYQLYKKLASLLA